MWGWWAATHDLTNYEGIRFDRLPPPPTTTATEEASAATTATLVAAISRHKSRHDTPGFSRRGATRAGPA